MYPRRTGLLCLADGARSMGYDDFMPLMPYGDRYRQYRKLISGPLGSKGVQALFQELESDSRKLLFGVLNTPTELRSHIRRCAVH